MLLLLKVISERCGDLPIGTVVLNMLGCDSDGYRLAIALLRIRLRSVDAIENSAREETISVEVHPKYVLAWKVVI